ncbi:MAG: diguanylate cyclase [Acidobacteriota bacterium]
MTGSTRFKAKCYFALVTVAGIGVLTFSLDQVLRSADSTWVALALLTAGVSFFPVYLPRLRGKDRGVVLTISSICIFTSILVFGPAVAAVLSTIEAGVSCWRSRRSMSSLSKILFNLFHLPVVSYLIASLFYLLARQPAPLDLDHPPGTVWLFLTVGGCAVLYFLLNAGAVALAISLVTGHTIRQTWQQSFLSAALTNVAEASAAVVVFLNFQQSSILAVGIALPTAVVIYYAYKMNLARIHEAQQHVEEVNDLYQATIEALALAVDAKDQVTHGHIYRVQAMVVGLARYCGVTNEHDLEGLRAAALLHDIGKLATPDYILNKPGPLTDSEMETMRAHAGVGAGILASVPFPYPVVPYVLYHHEKWDGSGYPEGLKGEEIPLGARILSIADCYDALCSDRPYRPRLRSGAAIEYIKSEAGKAYDPLVVEQLISHIDELDAEMEAAGHHAGHQSPREFPIHRAAQREEEKGIANTVFHDIASAHREVQALHEISQAVGRLLTVSETLSLLADKIKTLVPYDACSIYLADSDNDKLVPYHTSGICSDQLNSLIIKIGEGVTGWAAANQRSLMNVSPQPDFRGWLQLTSRFKSCLAMPLLLDHDVVGVITLYSRNSNGFRQNQLRLMENIASHAGTAINNAIIYEGTQEDAYTDVLTGLPNLRYFNVSVEQELKRARNARFPVTVIMMDLDSFKRVNDEQGHKTGDRVLIEIAHVLRSQMRKTDTCIRYGGDEFIGILPRTEKCSVQAIIHKIQGAVDTHTISFEGRKTIRVGISIGAATFPDDGTRLDQLLVLADQRMYQNKIERASQEKPSSRVVSFVRKAESA